MNDKIQLAHGTGGKLSQDLIAGVFLKYFRNPVIKALDDSAILNEVSGRLALTTDSYVVNPIFFPGGDIGKLAVCGTVNDLSMVGARPLAITTAFILEEGFPLVDLNRVLSSMKEAAAGAGVAVVAGDTKVVARGEAAKIFINTAGIGLIPEGVHISGSSAEPGDAVLVSGPLGDHEMTVLVARGEFEIQGRIKSDCAPLNGLVADMLESGVDIHSMRDVTRGGLATVLYEIAQASDIGILVKENNIPLRNEVRNICSLLGFDPLYLANEGCLIAFCPEKQAHKLLDVMRKHRFGEHAEIIGTALPDEKGQVILETEIGGHRLLEPLTGSQFPRIC